MTAGTTGAALERPRNVTLALRILWSFFVIGLLVFGAFFILNYDAIHAQVIEQVAQRTPNITPEQLATAQTTATAGIIFMVVIAAIIYILVAFFYIMVGKGKNWARILLLVLSVLGIAYQIYTLLQGASLFADQWSAIMQVTSILSTLATVISLVLLFSHSANPYFEHKKPVDTH